MDLWTNATTDLDAERHDRLVTSARLACVGDYAFAAQASTRDGFEDRLALVADRVDEKLASLVERGNGIEFDAVREAVLSGWRQDFTIAMPKTAKTVLDKAQQGALRNVPAGDLKVGDQIFNPSMGTMYRTKDDGGPVSFDIGIAPLDGVVWTVTKVGPGEMWARSEDGVEQGGPIPAGEKMLRMGSKIALEKGELIDWGPVKRKKIDDDGNEISDPADGMVDWNAEKSRRSTAARTAYFDNSMGEDDTYRPGHDDFYDDHSGFGNEPRSTGNGGHNSWCFYVKYTCPKCGDLGAVRIENDDSAEVRCKNGHRQWGDTMSTIEESEFRSIRGTASKQVKTANNENAYVTLEGMATLSPVYGEAISKFVAAMRAAEADGIDVNDLARTLLNAGLYASDEGGRTDRSAADNEAGAVVSKLMELPANHIVRRYLTGSKTAADNIDSRDGTWAMHYEPTTDAERKYVAEFGQDKFNDAKRRGQVSKNVNERKQANELGGTFGNCTGCGKALEGGSMFANKSGHGHVCTSCYAKGKTGSAQTLPYDADWAHDEAVDAEAGEVLDEGSLAVPNSNVLSALAAETDRGTLRELIEQSDGDPRYASLVAVARRRMAELNKVASTSLRAKVGSIEQAIETARQNISTQRSVVAPEYQTGYTIVDAGGQFKVYQDDAWEKPAGNMLPWSAPTGKPVARVDLDGKVTMLGSRKVAEFPPKKKDDSDDKAPPKAEKKDDAPPAAHADPNDPNAAPVADPAAAQPPAAAAPAAPPHGNPQPSQTGAPNPAAPGAPASTDPGSDPAQMEIGATSQMTYTMTEGTTGSVEVVFIREDKGVYYFNGPSGEFGVTNTAGSWQDAEGNNFTFSSGDGSANEDDPMKAKEADPGVDATKVDAEKPAPEATDAKGEKKDKNPFAKKEGAERNPNFDYGDEIPFDDDGSWVPKPEYAHDFVLWGLSDNLPQKNVPIRIEVGPLARVQKEWRYRMGQTGEGQYWKDLCVRPYTEGRPPVMKGSGMFPINA